MNKAFVFGKFYPFHKGHKALINFALTQCDFLSIMVCASDQEKISVFQRKRWIEKTFTGYPQLEIIPFEYNEADLTNSSVTSKTVSKEWAAVFQQYFPNHHTVITSEGYGELVAEEMDIKHIPFDLSRTTFPISASQIREDYIRYWDYLPFAVKADFALTIVILGTESTGKTTLTQNLAEYFQAQAVYEAGRDIIPDSSEFQFADLDLVAHEQAKRIEIAKKNAYPIIIVDTDIHITKSYALFSFGQELQISDDIYKKNQADIYLYLENDVDFVQDGTRMNEELRNQLDWSHKQVLKQHNIAYYSISGDWGQRFELAKTIIENAINHNKNKWD